MTEICEVLGKKDKAKDYGNIAAKMKTSIQEGIMRRNLMPDDLMGAYVLAFAFGLVPEDLCDAYKEKFLSLLEKSGRCIGTGFLATLSWMCCVIWEKQKPPIRSCGRRNGLPGCMRCIMAQQPSGNPGMQMMQPVEEGM